MSRRFDFLTAIEDPRRLKELLSNGDFVKELEREIKPSSVIKYAITNKAGDNVFDVIFNCGIEPSLSDIDNFLNKFLVGSKRFDDVRILTRFARSWYQRRCKNEFAKEEKIADLEKELQKVLNDVISTTVLRDDLKEIIQITSKLAKEIPDAFFVPQVLGGKSVPPTARFKAVHALKGDPWKAAVSAKKEQKKKTVVIYGDSSELDFLRLRQLIDEGFLVGYFQENDFVKLSLEDFNGDYFSEIFAKIPKKINEKQVCKNMAKLGISKDEVLLLDLKKDSFFNLSKTEAHTLGFARKHDVIYLVANCTPMAQWPDGIYEKFISEMESGMSDEKFEILKKITSIAHMVGNEEFLEKTFKILHKGELMSDVFEIALLTNNIKFLDGGNDFPVTDINEAIGFVLNNNIAAAVNLHKFAKDEESRKDLVRLAFDNGNFEMVKLLANSFGDDILSKLDISYHCLSGNSELFKFYCERANFAADEDRLNNFFLQVLSLSKFEDIEYLMNSFSGIKLDLCASLSLGYGDFWSAKFLHFFVKNRFEIVSEFQKDKILLLLEWAIKFGDRESVSSLLRTKNVFSEKEVLGIFQKAASAEDKEIFEQLILKFSSNFARFDHDLSLYSKVRSVDFLSYLRSKNSEFFHSEILTIFKKAISNNNSDIANFLYEEFLSKSEFEAQDLLDKLIVSSNSSMFEIVERVIMEKEGGKDYFLQEKYRVLSTLEGLTGNQKIEKFLIDQFPGCVDISEDEGFSYFCDRLFSEEFNKNLDLIRSIVIQNKDRFSNDQKIIILKEIGAPHVEEFRLEFAKIFLENGILNQRFFIEVLGLTLSDVEDSFGEIKDFKEIYEAFDKKSSQVPLEAGSLYFSTNSRAEFSFVTKDEDTPFQMSEAGRIINFQNIHPQYPIRTRCGTFSLSDFNFTPASRNLLSPLSPQQVEALRGFDDLDLENKADSGYALFSANLMQGELVQLFSVNFPNQIARVKTNPPNVEIQIIPDDKGFYNVFASGDCEFEYILEFNHNPPDLPVNNPANNSVKILFDEYQENRLQGVNFLPQRSDYSTEQEFLREVFISGQGSCKLRVAAFINEMRHRNILNENLNIVDIDRNHVALEIYENGQIYYLDLGGIVSQLVLNDEKERIAISSGYLGDEEIDERGLGGDIDDDDFLSEGDSPLEATKDEGLENQGQKEIPGKIQGKIQGKMREEMQNFFARVTNPKILTINASDLFDVKSGNHWHSSSYPCLVIAANTSKIINTIIASSTKLLLPPEIKEFPVFIIDDPEKIDFGVPQLKIDANGNIICFSDGFLADFFNQAHLYLQASSIGNHQGQRPKIVIDWSKFNDQQKAALNTLLDEAKSIKGFNFSKIDVIGVDTKLSKDLSFLNRHKNFYHLKEQKEPKLQTKKATEVFEIDLEGFEDWREKLFGEIYLNQEGKTCWKKSAFVEIIEGGNSSFNVQNCSNRELLELEIQRAKARGYFDYHGYKIPLTENFLMNIGSKDFDFSQFSNQHFLFENRTINKVPTPKCKIINSQIFDSLLAKKTITEDGRYFEEKGLIANAKNSQLSIFITSQLSEAQNYVLLNEAKKHNVRLSIYLAPNVKMPEGLKTKETPQGDIRKSNLRADVILCKDSRLIIDDVANGKIAQGLKEDDLIIVNAKDLVFANLINYTSFKEEAGVFKNFKIVESELFKALKEGKTVILEGHCRKSPKQLNFKNLQLS